MRNAPEVVREVGVHDVRMTTEQQLLHLYSGLLGVAPSAVGVDFRWKVGFEDRLQHQHRCCHADPIPHGRDAQRPEFAVGLRYEHPSDRLRSVCLLPERKRQLSQPPLDPIRFDVPKVLAVHARCALVGAALVIGMCQNILAADLVVQGVEAITGFLPSLSRVTPSAASEHVSELLGCPISRSLTACCVCLEPRPLPSPGIIRLQRYYEPLRHPRAPGLSLTGIRLIIPDHAMGLPVWRALSLCTSCRHYPGAADGPRPRSRLPHPCQPSPEGLPGRPAHRPFRGLLSVYSRCGLHTRAVTNS